MRTRDIVFSPDGTRMFVSVGSAVERRRRAAAGLATCSCVAGSPSKPLGATWGNETDRADVLAFDPEGKNRRIFATGIRNCVGMAIKPATGELWCSTNERDGLGDNLPSGLCHARARGRVLRLALVLHRRQRGSAPPRRAARPRGKVTIPDVLIQAHSASLGMTFYAGAQFPADYTGSAFAAEHGSWNRAKRTGYKIIRIVVKDGVPTGEYEDFVTGFVVDDARVWGRPVGVARPRTARCCSPRTATARSGACPMPDLAGRGNQLFSRRTSPFGSRRP